jgi:hypothetical protein
MDIVEAERTLKNQKLGWENHTIRSFKILTAPGTLLEF